jgi:hypothetical protein
MYIYIYIYSANEISKPITCTHIVSNLLITNNYINFNDFTRQELIIIMKDCVTCYRQIQEAANRVCLYIP